MSERLSITKTYKLYIGGKFPRTESGRTTAVTDASNTLIAHVCHASRKDIRDAVEAAQKAQEGWANTTAYLRGQILYRLAEMMEGKRAELASAIVECGEDEVARAIDRVVHFAGWTDKFPMIAGGANPVAGPYHNFTVPFPVGVTGVVCPDEPSLLGLITLVAPVIAMGNACVVLASETNPIPAMVLAEALATSDLPGGVVNILTGFRDELCPHLAEHRGVIAIHAGGLTDAQRTTLRLGSANNMKRVTIREHLDYKNDDACEGPRWLEPFVEFKTIWHPSAV
ncbi:MAG: aldehyde dehydrogenase family protein [Planctomycetota bacterium]|nr:MAG: aldehyde dehydrogenase family protein [Planctomycetota bacterium]